MQDEVRAQFWPEFVVETRARLRAALSLIPPAGPGGKKSAETIAAMMHSISGEAMLIGSPELAVLARATGGAARRYVETTNDAALVACARALRTFARTVDDLSLPDIALLPSAESAPKLPAHERPRILVVDDSPLNAVLMREILLRQGFDAISIGDDFELVLQRLAQFRPQVLLVDWLMPGCDTRKLCHRIRSTPELAHMRVLLITSLPQHEAAAQALSLNVDGAVSKEQGMSAIVDRVREVLQARR